MLAIHATTTRRTVPVLRPFSAYLRLELRRAIRNRRYLVMTVVFPVVIYVLYTAIIAAPIAPYAAIETRKYTGQVRPPTVWSLAAAGMIAVYRT